MGGIHLLRIGAGVVQSMDFYGHHLVSAKLAANAPVWLFQSFITFGLTDLAGFWVGSNLVGTIVRAGSLADRSVVEGKDISALMAYLNSN